MGAELPFRDRAEVDTWVLRLAAVAARPQRMALWAETLGTVEAAAGARLLDSVVRGALLRQAAAVAAYDPLLDLPALTQRCGAGRLAAVLSAAEDLELEGCQLLLQHPGPPLRGEELGPPPDPLLETMTVGHRRAAARGPRGPVLERILRDPDPRVVREVLRNSRLREAEVVAVACRRPCPAAVFRLLLASETWSRRPAVQRAVVHNPYAPPRTALTVAVLLASPELVAVAEAEGLHPAVRDGARWLLAQRRSG